MFVRNETFVLVSIILHNDSHLLKCENETLLFLKV